MSALTKIVAIVAAASMLAPVALAEGLSVSEKANVSVDLETSRGTATEAEDIDEDVNENSDDDDGVSASVQALLKVADRDDDIGEEVRDIAHEYASSTKRSDEDKQNVEDRSALVTLLIGADYKNLGALRSEIATTQNAINRLTKARDRATDASVKAALTVQIQTLTASASSTEAYVKAHEDVFSIFGWFFKLFS